MLVFPPLQTSMSQARSKFGSPMFKPEVFQKQMHCTEESTCDIVGTFWHLPQRFDAWESVSPCLPFILHLQA